MKEFEELILSFADLDRFQKKAVLSSTISDNMLMIKSFLSNKGIQIDLLNTELLKELKISDDEEYLINLYVLICQYNDMVLKSYDKLIEK